MTLTINDFNRHGDMYLPKVGIIGGKSEGEKVANSINPGTNFSSPLSLALPSSITNNAIRSFSREELLTMDVHDKKIEILSKELPSVIDLLVTLFPNRLAIRSSDSAEDSLETRLPGLYQSKLIGKISEENYRKDILDAFVNICTDYVSTEKATFRIRKNMNEELGILTQDIVGRIQGDPYVNEVLGIEHFFPDISGYVNTAFPEKVILGLCKGFGETAVDGFSHHIFEYNRNTGDIKTLADTQEKITLLKNNKKQRVMNDKPLEISEEFIKLFLERVLNWEAQLKFPKGYGLDFEFAIPSYEQIEIFRLQNAPLPIKNDRIDIELPSNPIVTYGSCLGVGEKVFTEFAFMPPFETEGSGVYLENQELQKAVCPYDPTLLKYNEEHQDYLLFILPQHIWKGNSISPNGTFKFTNTYNAGGVVEVCGSIGSHSPAEGAAHFQNFMRALDQMFIAGKKNDVYNEIYNRLKRDNETKIIVGKGEIYMAVDENQDKGILDLKTVTSLELYGG